MQQSLTVKVTLEKPWHIDGQGNEQPVKLLYGYTEARKISSNGSIQFAGQDFEADEMVDVGTYQALVPRTIRQYIPGSPIEYTVLYSDPEQNGILIPMHVARVYFGDWRIPKVAEPGTPVNFTHKYERDRVAMRWGWWKMPQLVRGSTHLSRGQEAPDITKIGTVDMPKVHIESVDARGIANGKVSFRPWEHYDFSSDVVPDQNAIPQREQASPLASFTIEDLRKLLAAAEAQEASPAAEGVVHEQRRGSKQV